MMNKLIPPKNVLFVLLLFSCIAFAQVGINTNSPGAGSILDIESSDKGLLLPRVDIADLSSIDPITGGSTESLLVYNTNTTTGKGFHYWTGSSWQPIDRDWKLTGNAGTDPGVGVGNDFLGTTDSQDLVFATNSDEKARLLVNGYFGINTVAAEEYLDVHGDIDMGGGSANWDSQGENIKFRAQSDTWWIAAQNEAASSDSHFYIGTTQNPSNAQFLIANDGKINIGADNEYDPLDMLHVTNDDEDETTTIRIDNTRNANDIIHTSLELWDGSSGTGMKAFFRHNNNTNELEIGEARGNGSINFFAGNGGANSGSSEIVAVIDNNGNFGIGNDDTSPNALLHITKDQDDTTALRIDNDNDATSISHTGLELWDGSSSTGKMAVFNHDNSTDILKIGHSRGNGVVSFYSGDGSGSGGTSSISMTLESDNSVTVENSINVKPGTAPSSPKTGDIYYHSVDNKLRVYTGSVWEDLN